jgi:hypothetical protein
VLLDLCWISRSRLFPQHPLDDLFDGVEWARAFDNDYDLDMHEPGD